MSHTQQKKSKLLSRARRIRGQVEAVERALDADKQCYEILQLVTSIRGAVNGMIAEMVEDHIRNHVIAEISEKNSSAERGAEELIELIKSYMK